MILDAGARFVGKTQTDELAFSLMGQNAHFPFPVNPAAPDRVTGGSSSGSAAAVAGRLADIATGSDTGGSIRAPASFCGLIGLRTTHGRISLEGTMQLAPSFDTFGWFADDIETYETIGKLLLGRDPHQHPLNRPLSIRWLDAFVAGPAEAAEYARMRALAAALVGEPKPVDTSSLPSPTSSTGAFAGCRPPRPGSSMAPGSRQASAISGRASRSASASAERSTRRRRRPRRCAA